MVAYYCTGFNSMRICALEEALSSPISNATVNSVLHDYGNCNVEEERKEEKVASDLMRPDPEAVTHTSAASKPWVCILLRPFWYFSDAEQGE